ncbi:hypothetical protein G3T36_17320 [Diaminobutyricibacter tongyongensis]|uniref:Uncharacterized protein n=1 Tax=Leifsonia tongyongensis TaxID=1268043 RepID=A0A6L9Y1T2_9MICO|nr:hypothetical protein [Diaminobutyricibacter tongyongensis]NEN07620.1 hypothetical protein [Diaminobutyricibacter tongyongensis]
MTSAFEDLESSSRVQLFFEQVAVELADPGEWSQIQALIDYANATDDPALELAVLAGAALQQYAKLLVEGTSSRDEALAYVQQALMWNDMAMIGEGSHE